MICKDFIAVKRPPLQEGTYTFSDLWKQSCVMIARREKIDGTMHNAWSRIDFVVASVGNVALLDIILLY